MPGTSFKMTFTNTLIKGMKKYFLRMGIYKGSSSGADMKAKTCFIGISNMQNYFLNL